MNAPTILVLHGITMNGRSMLRNLGPLGRALKGAGFDLIAPDGGRAMTRAEAEAIAGSVSDAYRKAGQEAQGWFSDGVFWEPGGHFDWLDPVTDEVSGKKIYHAFGKSINAVEKAVDNKDVRGILGFSQGCAWGAVVTALARRRQLAFGDALSFGIYMSGFLPSFDEPALNLWPVEGEFHSRFVMGGRDPVFPDGRATIEELAQQFPQKDREVIVLPELGHWVADDPGTVGRLVDFASAHMEPA